MSNYANLKNAIQESIRQNGNNEITGNIMQQALIAIINAIAEGFIYKGVATPSTAPGTPDQTVFYLASQPGTYSNFGGLVIAQGEGLCVFTYTGSWSKSTTGVATSLEIQTLTDRFNLLAPLYAPLTMAGTLAGAIISTGVYRNAAGYTCHVIPVTGGQTIRIRQGSAVAYWGLVKSYTLPAVAGDSNPDYATGESARALSSSIQTVTVPSDAKFAIIPALINNADRTPSLIEVDGYDLLKSNIENTINFGKFISGQFVKNVAIKNDLSGGENDILSAEQGKVLNEEKQNRESWTISKSIAASVSSQQIIFEKTGNFGKDVEVELLSSSLPSNAYVRVIANIGSTPQAQKLLGVDATRLDIHSGSDDITYIKIYVQSVIEASAEVTLSVKYGEVRATEILENKVLGRSLIDETKISSTSASVNLFNNSLLYIPKGTKVIFELPEVGTVISEYRLYIDQITTYMTINSREYVYTAENDCTIQRISTTAAGTLQNGQNMNLKVYTLGIEQDVEELKRYISLSKNATKEDIIKAAGPLYDSINDSFSPGVISLQFVNDVLNKTKDLVCRFSAKYTSTDDAVYPYIQVYFMNPPLNGDYNRIQYKIGDKEKYRYGECKCITNIKTSGFAQSVWNGNYIIDITIPSGCTLQIDSFLAEYSNDCGDKDSFKVMQHGNVFMSEMNCETNWMGWSHINNYGAIVVPKLTLDGVWVCYHDDDELDNSNVVQKIDGTAVPHKKITELTYAETQTLQYRVLNSFGEHDKIPTLELFLQYCAKMGVHPVFSMHPTDWTKAGYEQLRALVEKYSLLEKLNIKGGYNNDPGQDADGHPYGFIPKIFKYFGSDIESFIIDFNETQPTQAQIEAIAAYEWQMDKIKVGVEFVTNSGSTYFSDAVLSMLRENGLVHGLSISGGQRKAEFIKSVIAKGCYEFCSDFFFSNGLNW